MRRYLLLLIFLSCLSVAGTDFSRFCSELISLAATDSLDPGVVVDSWIWDVETLTGE